MAGFLPGRQLILQRHQGPEGIAKGEFYDGLVLDMSSRIFSPREEKLLAKYFPKEYPAYRTKVLLPWL